MIINNTNVSEAVYSGNVQENKVGIDKENIDFITSILTTNLYSKPLNSFLRETVSNSVDSHREAGVKRPVAIILDCKNSSIDVHIRDFGTGISPERFDKIYRFIGSSTKRDSNNFIGGFGIGRFSVLSVTDCAILKSYYNGKLYTYSMYKNGVGINIDLVNTINTDEPNGLEVVAPIKLDNYYNLKLENALMDIRYFPNIILEVLDSTDKKAGPYAYSGIKEINKVVLNFNQRKINNFNYLKSCNYKEYYHTPFIILGNVAYSVDWDTVGYKPFRNYTYGAAIAVKIPVGEIQVTPNREGLQYTKKTIEAITKYADKALTEITEIAVKTSEPHYTTLATLEDLRNGQTYVDALFSTIDNSSDFIYNGRIFGTPIKEILTFEEFELLYNFIRDKGWYLFTIQVPEVYLTKCGGRGILKSYVTHINAIKMDNRLTSITNQYYANEFSSKEMCILKRECVIPLFAYLLNNMFSCVDKYGTKEKETKSVVTKFLKFLFKNTPIKTIRNADVPLTYITAMKGLTKTPNVRNTGRVCLREYFDDSYSIIDRKIEHLREYTVIYAPNTREDGILKDIRTILNKTVNQDKFKVITCKKIDLPIIENLRNSITVEDFLTKKQNILKKICTAKYLKKIRGQSEVQINKTECMFRRNLNTFCREYDRASCGWTPQSDKLLEDIFNKYLKNNWLDGNIIYIYTHSNDALKAANLLANTDYAFCAMVGTLLRNIAIKKFFPRACKELGYEYSYTKEKELLKNPLYKDYISKLINS